MSHINSHRKEGLTETSHGRGQAEQTHTDDPATVAQVPDLEELNKLKLGPAYPKGSDLRRQDRGQGQGSQVVPGRM